MAKMTEKERGDVFRGVFGTVAGLRAVDRESRRRALMDAAAIADETYQRASAVWAADVSVSWAAVAAWLRTIWYAEEDTEEGE